MLILLLTLAFSKGFCSTIVIQNCSVIPGTAPVSFGPNISSTNVPLGCISFGSGDSLTTAAQKCDGDGSGYPGSLSLRELIAILPYLLNIQPPVGDYIIDTTYSLSDGWSSFLDGGLYEINQNLTNFLGFSPAQCSTGDYLVWSLPPNYTKNKNNGTLKCSSDPFVPRNSFCLRYYAYLVIYAIDIVNSANPVLNFKLKVNDITYTSNDSAWSLLSKSRTKVTFEKSGFESSTLTFGFQRFRNPRMFYDSFQTHKTQPSNGLQVTFYANGLQLSAIEANGSKRCQLNSTSPICSRSMITNFKFQYDVALISDSAGLTFAFYSSLNSTQIYYDSIYGNATIQTGTENESIYFDRLAGIGKKYWLLGCFNGTTRNFVTINKYQSLNPASTIVETCNSVLA